MARRRNPRLNIPIPAREDPLPLPLHRLPLPPGGAASRDVEELSELERLEILGHGSEGNVYRVRHRRTAALYALKVIHGKHDQATRRQIIREMEILKKTNSPYVVKCHGIFDKGEEIHFVLEYMDGGSLQNAVGQPPRRMTEGFLADVARQVLEGLKYLHRQKIVHRDIKPSNLLVNRRQEVKIADFGVSRILSQTLDPCNTYVGTCAYMSPERFDPDSYGGRYDGYAGDIWSLGLSLLECFTGHFPFLAPGQKPDWPTLMCAICYGEPPSPPPTASAEFQSFIRYCLQKDARRRWTAVQLLEHPFILNSMSRGSNNRAADLSTSMRRLAI
uniref:mitogen-activated protein kinase kinase n=1 Tax=Araucaria cunninghamii TaxID=56994 RepID=A0A0D6R382_ARACU